MALRNINLLKIDQLADQNINDPEHRQDILPYPYSIINDVLHETIIYQLNLKMHEIQQKKKSSNYEGPVREYVTQSYIDVQAICCFSQPQKSHNHLLAGDKFGNVFLLDLAKRSVFSKKQIASGKKVIWIYDSMISDGDTSITTAAVINHNHHIISILRYRYSEPKLFLTDEIMVAADSSDPNNLPYSCELYDFCRLLCVKTYSGKILFFRLPQLQLDLEKKIKPGGITMQEQQIKKILKYPLQMVNLERQVKKNNEKLLEISFRGEKIVPKYSDVRNKLLGMKKAVQPPTEDIKKDPKKKQQKKVVQAEPEKAQPVVNLNKKLGPNKMEIVNGADITPNYSIPFYQPYVYIIQEDIPMPKSKYFEKARIVPVISSLVYGWKNTKQFYMVALQKPNLENIPQFLHLSYFQENVSQQKKKQMAEYLTKKINLSSEQTFRNVHPVTAFSISLPDKSLLALGLKDGTVSIWNPITQNLEFNTDKHSSEVTCLSFFEKWKLVSGDSSNQIFIHNVVTRKTEVKRTNIFQPKKQIPITSLQTNQLGITFCLDSQSNMRVYDLWRNQKIAKVNPCSAYALIQNKGKLWLPNNIVRNCSTIYTNRDFTVIISVNWPTFAQRIEDRSEQENKRQAQIKENPWKIPGTNTHVIRNYDFLLNLFEGLENVYKKGYERRKIQNLFTNLQYSQLNDRTFQIPDFSKPDQNMKKNQSTINKSLFSSGQHNSHGSLATSKSKQKIGKESTTGLKQVKLTSEVLHPQKFLFERRKIAKDMLVTTEKLVDLLRESHSKKEVRETKLNSDNSKSIF